MTRPTRWYRVLPAVLLAALTSCNPESVTPTGTSSGLQPEAGDLAPLLVVKEPIPDRYIVVLKDDVGDVEAVSRQAVSAHGGKVHHSYRHALKGFSATLTAAGVDAIRRSPSVALVAPVVRVRASTDQLLAPWSLDRIDQRALPLDNRYAYSRTGAGVTVYILDSGIRTTHSEFGSPSRALVGSDFVGDGLNGQDCNGHGTHVAGTVAGSTYGVAKGARVVSVRVLNCEGVGATDGIIAGIDWVTADVSKLATDETKVGGLPAVANMSLGAEFYEPANAAVQRAIDARVVVVAAAGNDNIDACNVSPASAPGAITVGATTDTDARSSFSNWGRCLDIFAPGSDILSASHVSDGRIRFLDGTSMAAPHVAGVAALYLEGRPVTTLPASAVAAILNSATVSRVSGAGAGSPNALLYSPLTGATTSLALNPSKISFTFVRTVAPLSASSASLSPATRPAFTMSGIGAPQRATSVADDPYQVVTTAAVLSAPVLLKNVGTAAREWQAIGSFAGATMSPREGSLAAGASAALTATVSSASLPVGSTTANIDVRDVTTATPVSNRITLSLNVHAAEQLAPGVPRTALSGPAESARYFTVVVPTGASNLTIATTAGTGNADLYVRFGQLPDLPDGSFDCRPLLTQSIESCSVALPPAGTYVVLLYGKDAYDGVTLSATVNGSTPLPPTNITFIVGPEQGKIALYWNDGSADETSFQIYRRMRNPDLTFGAWTLVNVRAPQYSSWGNSGLAPATTYQYRLRACNAVGCSAYATSELVTTLLPTPVAPTNLVGAMNFVMVLGGGVVTPTLAASLTWNDASLIESNFALERRTKNADLSFGAWGQISLPAANATSHNDFNVTAGTSYEYRIRACNTMGCSAFAVSNLVVITHNNPW